MAERPGFVADPREAPPSPYEPREPTAAEVDELAAVIHDATPPSMDGGVPDVCNNFTEHQQIARAVLLAGYRIF